MQRTVKRRASLEGLGLHTGALVSMEILPAPANTGIIFVRTDLPGRPTIKASPQAVFDTTLATRIGSPSVFMSTIEHFMAAAFGFGIDNAYVEVNNMELPILDGSSMPFLVALDEAGVEELPSPKSFIQICKPIEVVDEKNPERFIRIESVQGKRPHITYSIDFAASKLIGQQSLTLPFGADAFCREFSYARTFCLLEEVEFMQSKGLARGGSLNNAIVVSKKDGILNSNGLRDELEFVRHKVLDCIGDLYLTGSFVSGDVYANKAGHDLHTKLALKIVNSLGSEYARIVKESDTSQESRKVHQSLQIPSSLEQIFALRWPKLVTG